MTLITDSIQQEDGYIYTKQQFEAYLTRRPFYFQSTQIAVLITNQSEDDLFIGISGVETLIKSSNSLTLTNAKQFEVRGLKENQKFLVQAWTTLSQLFDDVNETSATKMGFAYNTNTALRQWRAALARIANGSNEIVNVNFIGDSITEGAYTTGNPGDFQTKGYVGRIRSALQADYGDAGMGFVPVTYPYSNPQWKLTGAWTSSTIGFGAVTSCMTTTTAGNTAEFTFNGTGISVFFGGNSTTGKVLISIDGGTETEFDTFDTVINGKKEYQVNGLTAGAHTILVKKANDTKPIYLLGSCEVKGTKGIRVNNCSRWGMRSINASGDYHLELEITRWAPKLTIIAFMANDAGSNMSSNEYKTNIMKIVNKALNYGSVLLLSTGISESATSEGSHYRLNNVLRDIALENPNIAFLDLFNRWGGNGAYVKNTLGFLQDNVHPNGGGHIDIASAVYDVIHGSSISLVN